MSTQFHLTVADGRITQRGPNLSIGHLVIGTGTWMIILLTEALVEALHFEFVTLPDLVHDE